MMADQNVWAATVMTLVLITISSTSADLGSGRHAWERPGCHLTGKYVCDVGTKLALHYIISSLFT